MSVFRIYGVIFFALTGLAQGAAPGQPAGLRVNYAKEPVIDTTRPLFSWNVKDVDRGEVQTAYQLRVASSRERCVAGQGDLWDTGKILSSSQADIPYGGAELASRQSCWWQVRTWDQAGQEGAWSVPATFEMALLKPSDWTASWIGGDYQRYRTEVNLPADKTVVRARAYISAKEIFNLTLNGQRVGGDRVMEPGESVFAKRMRYCTYDVTAQLRPGANVLGMEIGRGRIGHWWLKSGDREFLLQIEAFYSDGSSMRLVSDKGTWKATTSGPRIPLPPNKSELYQGETYDARLEDGWGNPGYDDRSWTTVAEARPADYSGRLVAQTAPPMKKRALMKAVAITQPWPGVHVFDFGQKISGWSQLSVKGPRGATVTLRHGDKPYTKQTWADYTLTLNAKIIKGAAGIRFRIADDDNFYLAQLSTNGMLTLSKKVKGAWSRLKDVPAGLVEDKTYAVKIELAGETIKTSIDGKLIDTTTDKSFGSGKVGFWQHGDETAAFEHIYVAPASGFDLSRGNKYSLAERSQDPGFWINRANLKTVTLPKKKPEDKSNPIQFVLTDNETMMSYDGGLTGQVDQSNTHVFFSRYFADSTERYTLKGGETEVWEPQFTLHGFRYVEVTGYPGVPTVENIQARPAHGAIDEEPGSFACSNELLNKLHSAFVWTFKSSAQFGYCADYGRDERTGWVANNSWGEVYNFDILNLYDSWLTDYQDTQLPNGKISRVAPFQDLSEIPVIQEASTVWLASYLTQPWDVYTAYGSKELLKKRYESMKKLVDYLRTDKVTQNIDSKGKYANWATQSLRPSTAFTAFLVDPKLAATAVLYQCVGILAKMAKELGCQEDAEYYAAQGELIKTAFNGKFLLQDKTYVGEDRYNKPVQTALTLALDMGLCPESARENVVRSLIDNIRSNDMHLTTGVCGTRSLLPALCDNGQEEIAYKLATQTTFPSWGKWILDGHTTCCEHWDGHLSSDIYYLGGSLDAYFYKYLAGIAPTRPGYEEVRIKPHVKNDLTNVVAVVNTVRGAVRSEWRRPAPGHFVLKVSVPANAKAMVHVPRLGLETAACRLTEGGTILWDQGQAVGCVPGVNFIDVQGDYLVWAVGSGDYRFELLPLAAAPAADQPKAAGKVKAGDAGNLCLE